MDAFYGTDKPKTLTYLEFGEIDVGKGGKKVWDFRINQKAYDWLMLGRYSNDLIIYKKMMTAANYKKIRDLYFSEIHHKNDSESNLNKIIGLLAVEGAIGKNKRSSFFEFGQTIFGCIEGMEFIQKYVNRKKTFFKKIDLKKNIWYGLDISGFFNELAIILHPEYNVVTSIDFSKLPNKFNVFFAKGISLLYAVRSARQLISIIDRADLSVFDYSFSFNGGEETTIGSGKTIKYLDFNEFLREYKKNGKIMFVCENKSFYNNETKRVYIECVYGSIKYCGKFIQLHKDLFEKFSTDPEISGIMPDIDKFNSGKINWIPVDEFINKIKM